MNNTEQHLLIDTHFLAWRAYYSTGQLRDGSGATGVLFGVLRELKALQERFRPARTALCFDKGLPLRRKVFSTYKESRNKDPEVREQVSLQIRRLRKEILPALGYANILSAKGYEADDLIASLCHSLREGIHGPDIVIVSSDHDLYQLLGERIRLWNPRTASFYGLEEFRKDWHLEPERWHWVKAIAGCSTDDIPGVAGVGEKTAARFLRGEVKGDSTIALRIKESEKLWKRNKRLVKLPFQDCPTYELKADTWTVEKWNTTCKALGFPSLIESFVRRKGKA